MRREAHGGGSLQVAVQASAAQFVGEGGCRHPEVLQQGAVGRFAGLSGRGLTSLRLVLDRRVRLPEGSCLGVDGPGRLVPEQVADHRRQQEGQAGVDLRYCDDVQGPGEPGRACVGDDHRCGPVGPVDGHLLGHVVGSRAHQPRGAHQDHRLGRQVDVLLVLGGIRGDRLVAELRELDPDLPGRCQVRTAAHHRPVASGRSVPFGDLGNPVPHGQHVVHGIGQALEARQHLGPLR